MDTGNEAQEAPTPVESMTGGSAETQAEGGSAVPELFPDSKTDASKEAEAKAVASKEESTTTEGVTAEGTAPSLTAPKDGDDSAADDGVEGNAEYTPFTYAEGVEENTDALSHFAPVMLEAGLGQEGAQLLVNALSEYEQGRFESNNQIIEAQRTADIETLRNDVSLGATEEEFMSSMVRVDRVMTMPGGAQVNELLKAHGIDNDPAFVKWVAEIGTHFSEDSLVHGKQADGGEARPEDLAFHTTVGM